MSAADLLEAIAYTRAAFLEVERAAADELDEELDGRVACARLAILDVADYAAQLINADVDALLELGDEAAA